MPAVMYSEEKKLAQMFCFNVWFCALFVCLFFKLALGSEQRYAPTVVLTGGEKKVTLFRPG